MHNIYIENISIDPVIAFCVGQIDEYEYSKSSFFSILKFM